MPWPGITDAVRPTLPRISNSIPMKASTNLPVMAVVYPYRSPRAKAEGPRRKVQRGAVELEGMYTCPMAHALTFVLEARPHQCYEYSTSTKGSVVQYEYSYDLPAVRPAGCGTAAPLRRLPPRSLTAANTTIGGPEMDRNMHRTTERITASSQFAVDRTCVSAGEGLLAHDASKRNGDDGTSSTKLQYIQSSLRV